MSKYKIKAQSQINSFVHYCTTHPDERFWQALRNWSEYNFIYGSSKYNTMDNMTLNDLEDTFYKE